MFRGEDMNFFDDAKKLGFDLWVEPKITLGHIGAKIYNASIWTSSRPSPQRLLNCRSRADHGKDQRSDLQRALSEKLLVVGSANRPDSEDIEKVEA
jgi:hypothetical protein